MLFRYSICRGVRPCNSLLRVISAGETPPPELMLRTGRLSSSIRPSWISSTDKVSLACA
jgi:hypothetical protein